jgi:hypothetical protein
MIYSLIVPTIPEKDTKLLSKLICKLKRKEKKNKRKDKRKICHKQVLLIWQKMKEIQASLYLITYLKILI